MQVHSSKTQEKINTMATQLHSPQTPTTGSVSQLVDNRASAIVQKKLQETANNSTQTIQARAFQETVNHKQQLDAPVVQKKVNNTGLPHQLKSGIESLSGISLDDVKVHYNSNKPAQLQAHAYAQGTDIHVASRQEKHLPHEAWHVVQQKQGRVQPTRQLKGKVNINDDAGLEKEADVMGAKALQMKSTPQEKTGLSNSSGVIQRWPITPNPDVIDREYLWQLSFQEFLNYRLVSAGHRNWIDNVYFHSLLGNIAPQDILGLLAVGVRKSILMRNVEFWLIKFRTYIQSLNPQRQGQALEILAQTRNSGRRFVRFTDIIAYLHMEMGYRRPGMLSSGDTRPPIPDFWIEAINTRSGEWGLFKNKKGDHTSAHVLFRRWLISTFRGADIEDVSSMALRLRSELIVLFNSVYDVNADEALAYQVSTAWSHACDRFRYYLGEWKKYLGSGMVQKLSASGEQIFLKLCMALMNMRNCLPYSAMQFGGTGGGEGPANAYLFDLDTSFRLGIRADRFDDQSDKIKSDWSNLLKNVIKLIDLVRIHDELSFKGDILDRQLVPGSTGNRDIDINNIIWLHLESIRMAYPALWAGLETLGLLGHLIDEIRDLILQGPGEDYQYNEEDAREQERSGMEGNGGNKKRKTKE